MSVYKVCGYCGKKLVKKRNKYCNHKCSGLAHKRRSKESAYPFPLSKVCPTCKKVFKKPRGTSYAYWKNERKYCDMKCNNLGKFGKVRGTSPLKGIKRPENSGKNHYNWKGGKLNSNGRIYILRPKHPRANKLGYVLRSRLNMEKELGRYLTKKEVVHHINRNTMDDRISNLELYSTGGKHSRFHRKNKAK